jgi:hypothetical protein
MGIFGSFKRANQVIADAKKDVKRPKKDEVAAQRDKKQQDGKK